MLHISEEVKEWLHDHFASVIPGMDEEQPCWLVYNDNYHFRIVFAVDEEGRCSAVIQQYDKDNHCWGCLFWYGGITNNTTYNRELYQRIQHGYISVDQDTKQFVYTHSKAKSARK